MNFPSPPPSLSLRFSLVAVQKASTRKTSSPGGQLLARARYNSVAEAADELSFRQGDIVTVIRKDHNGQADWWLCELRGNVGMVPANYFQILAEERGDAYDFPRGSAHTGSTPAPPPGPPLSPVDNADGYALYDLPPELAEATDRDYDLPPMEPADPADYDRPQSNRSSFKSSSASSLSRLNRLSTASSNASNSLYDVPPDPTELFDLPNKSSRGRCLEEDEKGPVVVAIDVSIILDEEAETLLVNYRQLISATYENLFQCVYGPEAYWGSDNKPRRKATLARSVTATKHFDRALLAMLEFGKGVSNALETSSSDANFRKKYVSAFRGLLQKRQEILAKLEALTSEIDSITATVKSLLELARTIPSAVTEFTVLVHANKALLFKQTTSDPNHLPVMTQTEVKSRPLPELPTPPGGESSEDTRDSVEFGDYASIPTPKELDASFSCELPPTTGRPRANTIESSLDWSYAASKKRSPNDNLPPLPYATMPRPPKSKEPAPQTPPPTIPSRGSPCSSRSDLYEGKGRKSPYGSRSDIMEGRRSPATNGHYTTRVKPPMGFDDVDGVPHNMSSGSLRSNGSYHVRPALNHVSSSPANYHIRQQSTGSISGSSDELNSSGSLKRVSSAELLDTPYGRPVVNGYDIRSASPKPLRQEDRDLLVRFSQQMDLVVPSLRESVDVFLDCLKGSEPPRDFVTKSKLSVVAAYKLVYIADALAQKILHNDTKAAILASSNRLTDSVKTLVSDTKTAALQYPSVIAVDKMGESLRKVFPAALELVDSVKSQSTMV